MQCTVKCCTLSQTGRIDPDCAAMSLKCRSRNSQSQTTSTGSRPLPLLNTVKTFENTIEMFGSYPHSFVSDAQAYLDVIVLQQNSDGPPLGRVRDSVVQQGVQGLPNAHSIADHYERDYWWDSEHKSVTRRSLLPVLHDRAQQFRNLYL